MQFDKQDLVQLVEKSSPLFERIKGDFLPDQSAQSNEVLQVRLEEWCRVAMQGEWQRFEQRLAKDGLDIKTILPYLGEVRLKDPEQLPGWTATLNQALQFSESAVLSLGESEEQALEANPDSSSACPFEEICNLFVQAAKQRLLVQAGNSYQLLTTEAHVTLEESLLRYLSALACLTLETEFSVFKTIEQHFSTFSGIQLIGQLPGSVSRKLYLLFIKRMLQGELLNFFREYCVLARLMATVTDLWVDTQVEFLQRLESDWTAIQQMFNEHLEAPLERVVQLKADLSDRHRGGRSVLILEFSSGLKLVYKPKNLNLESAYFQLTEWLNQEFSQTQDLANLLFKPLKVLTRPDYGWVEFVEHLPCQDAAEAQRYYQRAGILLCLIYALEGTDYHNENLIAHGEYPMPIDQETLLHPRPRVLNAEGQDVAMQNSASLQLQHSVLRTAFLPHWEFGPYGESRDISALAGTPDQDSALQVPKWQNINTDSMRLVYERTKTRPQANAVYLDDQQLNPYNYRAELIDGFQQMYRFLMEHRQVLSAPDGPLKDLNHQWVRFIFRHTKVYFSLHRYLAKPKYLRNGVVRSIHMDCLSRGLLVQDIPNLFWEILRLEHRSMEQFDVPMFVLRSDSIDLPLGAGDVIQNCFLEPSYNRVLEKIQALSEQDLEKQVGLIENLLHARVSRPQDGIDSEQLSPQLHQIAPLSTDKLVQQAIWIAQDLDRLAIRSENGHATWIAFVHILEINRSQLQPMPYRLYDGCLGVSLFLAALTKVLRVRQQSGLSSSVNCDEFRELALASVQLLHQSADKPIPAQLIKEVGIGGGLGCGSILYALVRMSQFLEEPVLLERAKEVASLITLEQITEDTNLDIMMGAAGLLLGLLTLYEVWPDDSVLQHAVACGNHLLEKRVESSSGHKAWVTASNGAMLTGMSHGAAGIAYALLRLYRITQDPALRQAALEAQAYETSVFVPGAGNWPDFRPPIPQTGPSCWCSWCHGAAGIGLARLGGRSILNNEFVQFDIETAIQTTQKKLFQDLDHLCCGNLGRVEFLLVAAQQMQQPQLLDIVQTQAAQVVVRAQQQGSFALGGDSQYSPGLFQGSAGIGYELLRVAYPDLLPSVLLWE